jgi:tetratricopeptide (TPR) repeat protein
MKKSILLFASILIATFTFAQSEKYVKGMENALAQMNEAEDITAIQDASNKFERIMNAEPNEWLPAYYTALCQVNMASQTMRSGDLDKVEAFVDKAQAAMDKALAIAPDESEIHALQGFIYVSRIWSDPQSGGPKFTPLAHQSFAQALALNPNNPRAYHLRGQLVFYTPEFWGGGPANAYQDLAKADELFSTFESKSSIHPDWGIGSNKHHLSKAEAATKKEE